MNDLTAPASSSTSGARCARMAEFLLSRKLEDLPSELVAETRTRLLDGLGCGLYGAVMPWGKISAQVVYDEDSRGAATIYVPFNSAACGAETR